MTTTKAIRWQVFAAAVFLLAVTGFVVAARFQRADEGAAQTNALSPRSTDGHVGNVSPQPLGQLSLSAVTARLLHPDQSGADASASPAAAGDAGHEPLP